MLDFLRLLTNRAVMGDGAVTLRQAFDIYDSWIQYPRITLAPAPGGVDRLLRDVSVPFLSKPATKAIADCYLAGFAEAVDAHLVTFDNGLARTARFRKTPVVLLTQ